MQDLGSSTRDQTHAACSGSRALTTEPPGKSPEGKYVHGEFAYSMPFMISKKALSGRQSRTKK